MGLDESSQAIDADESNPRSVPTIIAAADQHEHLIIRARVDPHYQTIARPTSRVRF
jgi:hypothetical protein